MWCHSLSVLCSMVMAFAIVQCAVDVYMARRHIKASGRVCAWKLCAWQHVARGSARLARPLPTPKLEILCLQAATKDVCSVFTDETVPEDAGGCGLAL